MASEPTDEIFWSKHRIDPRVVAALSSAEVDRIQAIAQGRIDSPNRARALEVLTVARGTEATDTLIEAARNESIDSTLRAAAVIQLGRIGGPETERALIELVGQTPDRSLRLRAVQALAKTASADALSAFDTLVEDDDPRVRQRALFARCVLAYRHGIGGFDLPSPAHGDLLTAPQDEGAQVSSEPASLNEAVAALDDLQRDNYGVRLARDQAYVIDCGPTRMLLALDTSSFDTLTSASSDSPQLLGLVAERFPEDGSYSVKWLVFSTPAERDVRLSVHRQTGEQVLYGLMVVERGSTPRFELNAVATVGNPAVTVTGEFADGRLSFSGASAASVGAAGGRAKNNPLRDEILDETPPEMQ